MKNIKEKKRTARHKSIRKRINAHEHQPRLSVHRSLKNIYVQAIDDKKADTLFSMSTRHSEVKSKTNYGGNVAAAQILGEIAAVKLKEKGILKIIFDRGGYIFHGRVKAVADGLRKGGIEF